MLRQRLHDPAAERRAEAIIDAVERAESGSLPVKELSDLESTVSRKVADRWSRLSLERRKALVRSMITPAEDDLTSNYERALAIGLGDDDREVRSLSANGLVEHALPSTVRALVKTLRHEQVPGIRVQIIEALDSAAERAAANGLPAEESDELLDILVTSAEQDPSRQVRQVALAALGYFQDHPSLSAFIDASYRSGDEDEMVHALRAMGRAGVSRWREKIEHALTNTDEDIRSEAVRAVASSGDQRFASVMVQLAYEDEAVRRDAIEALGEVGGDTAIRALQDLASSEDEEVAEAADAALEAATLLDTVRPPRR